MTILRHLRRIPVTGEGIGDKKVEEGTKEEEGECCKETLRGIEIDIEDGRPIELQKPRQYISLECTRGNSHFQI